MRSKSIFSFGWALLFIMVVGQMFIAFASDYVGWVLFSVFFIGGYIILRRAVKAYRYAKGL
ncbi:hypothetical protein [Antrihabitans sp. YC2-6]|uniref:hypothetical protein n=1 Tax=Antrihabitans sp. YC2-6 TaxID=2799498 RepID=UPI0018F55990|nr:hypothetical protein [Antrihabitans sp. YC2-6]MBJ8343922.1 hypothetical protein [Antrihabitans sp. YC2-6]